MSSQAGATNLPSDTPKTAGLDSTRISTNEQGIVLRYFAGIGRFSLTWLGPAYNQVAKPVKNASAGGKGSASTADSSHKYYADCAGAVCVGLVDALTEVWMQDNKVWSGNVTCTDGSDSVQITVQTYGTFTLYWGTETQPIDPILAAHGHPAYRGQCYIVFKQLYFGQDNTTAPNVEVVLQRAPKNTGLQTPTTLVDDIGPAHAMIELLTDQRFGLGWTAADTLDLPPWDAAATQIRAEGMAISPMLDNDQDARSLMVQFCEYFDGYIVAEPSNGGKLALRLARPFTGDPATLPLIGEYELLDVPNPSSQNWRDTFNEFTVKYNDQLSDFQDNSYLFIDAGNRRVVGEPLPTQLDRSFITKTALAMKTGAYAARLQSVPWVVAKEIHVRKEAAAGIEPGAFVRLTYSDYAETLVMRVMSRKVEADRSQSVQFELRADGYYNEILPYTPDVPPQPDVPLVYPQPPLFQRILEVPLGLIPVRDDQNKPQLTALVSRGSGLDIRFRVYSSEDNTTYDEDHHSRLFCTSGTLAAPLALGTTLDDGAGGILINFPGVDNGLDLETTSEPGRLKMRLLVFVEDEIIAYRNVVIVGPTQARLVGLRRGCYDTLMAAHAAGSAVAIIRRRDMRLWTDASYERNALVYLKIGTDTAMASLDLAQVNNTSITLTNRTACPLAPINLRINGVGVAPTYAAGANLLIEWDAASWRRHEFWASWDEAYSDPKLFHKVKILTADGVTTLRKVNLNPGVSSYTYASADLLADFGGSVPASFRVQVLSRRRGLRSIFHLEQIVSTAAQAATNPVPRTNWMSPSLMSQVLGACDPETLVDRNFALISARFSLSLPATAPQDEDGAPAAVQGNFTAIAAALNLTLFPVAASRDPEVASQANFELINAHW